MSRPKPHAYDPSNRKPPGVCRCGRRVQDPIHTDRPKLEWHTPGSEDDR